MQSEPIRRLRNVSRRFALLACAGAMLAIGCAESRADHSRVIAPEYSRAIAAEPAADTTSDMGTLKIVAAPDTPPPAQAGDGTKSAARAQPGTTEAKPAAAPANVKQSNVAAKEAPGHPTPAENTDELASEIRARILAAQADRARRDKSKAPGQFSAQRVARPTAKPAAPGATINAQQPVKKKAGCGSSGDIPAPSTTGPHPVWTCEQSTVKLEPVWKGKPLEFNFKVANKGEADLHVRLKGG